MKLFHSLCIFLVLFATISLTVLFSISPQSVPNQAFFFVLGFALCFGVSRMPFRFLVACAKPAYVVCICALLFTLVLGKTTKGSTRWISFGFSQIQPSQVAKPIMALSLAVFVAHHSLKKQKALLQYCMLAGLPIVLVFLQPDLGTSLVMCVMAGTVLFFSDISPKLVVFLVGLGIVGGILGWNVLLHNYQRQRVISFFKPDSVGQTTGYHSAQSVITVGSGKLFGRGLGRGVQSHLRFLPERQTDFFFASLAEEFGFVGSLLIILLYLSFFVLLFRYAEALRAPIATRYVYAILAALCAQMTINIGMNIGVLPITGITLPFLSLGGSSIIALSIALGGVVSAIESEPSSVIEIRSLL